MEVFGHKDPPQQEAEHRLSYTAFSKGGGGLVGVQEQISLFIPNDGQTLIELLNRIGHGKKYKLVEQVIT